MPHLSPLSMHPLPAPETKQGLRKPNSPGMKEDSGSRFFQVRSDRSELACPNAEEHSCGPRQSLWNLLPKT